MGRRTFFQTTITATALVICGLIASAGSAIAQAVSFPARGFFNGFLNQVNVLECENTSASSIGLALVLKSNSGEGLGSLGYSIPAYGSSHIILNDIASISDRYGSFILRTVGGNENQVHNLSCRVAFYRSGGASKAFQFGYVIPLRDPGSGVRGGIYNSFDPSGGPNPVLNWLSIINTSDSAMSGQLESYDYEGKSLPNIPVTNLQPGERRDFPLGHPVGQTSGVYLVRPADLSQTYEAFLVRYGSIRESFAFAFPLRSLPGGCDGQRVQISTMGNGLTQNWLEVANLGELSATAMLRLFDRNGNVLHTEPLYVAAHQQTHFYVNRYLDPAAAGNVGSAALECDSNTRLLLESAYYGRLSQNPSVEWAYSVQGEAGASAGISDQLVVPINTYLGMANWLKLSNESGTQLNTNSTILREGGTALPGGSASLSQNGTADLALHVMAGSNAAGAVAATIDVNGTFAGEVLRVLPKANGQIGYIMHIPAAVQPRTVLPQPALGFPRTSVWYQDISAAPLDRQSSTILSWLRGQGGWGNGNQMQIDFNFQVLEAGGETPLRSFVKTNDFSSPDCDYQSVPLPPAGALEGEARYSCANNGRCRLIGASRSTGKLFEMSRANITSGTFYGGCLAVWDMNRAYGLSGRGERCASADAAGYPITPLLFNADEVASGSIDHAIRFVLPSSRIRYGSYVHPATHSTHTAGGCPSYAVPYGARLRLRANYPIENLPSVGARVVARALQRYGMLLADEGETTLTAQSDRFTRAKWANLLGPHDLAALRVQDFEIVDGGTRMAAYGECQRGR